MNALQHIHTLSKTGRVRIIAEGSYMYVYYYKLMFPYKMGILDPAYFISFNRRFLNFLGASILAYLHLQLDDWSIIKEYHGDYQDLQLFQMISKHTEEIVRGDMKIKDIVVAIATGSEIPNVN